MMTPELIVEAMLDGKTPWIPPDLPDPVPDTVGYDPELDTQELALEYVEDEVGRLDFEHNWPQHKKQHGGKLHSRVLDWLFRYEIDHDPQAIIDYIDNKLIKRSGPWI